MSMPAELARKAIVTISASMAKDAEALADDIELRDIPMTGPQALRLFAEGIRKAAEIHAETSLPV